MKFFFRLLLLTGLSALTGAAWVAHRAENLAAVEAAKPGGRQRELVDDLKQAAIKRSAVFEISEAEINRHLAKALSGSLPKDFSWAKFERVAVELDPDVARATLLWDVHGHRSSATVDFKVLRQNDSFRIEVVGGKYGHLTVPHGLLRPLAPALEKLAGVLQDEIQALFQMNQIQIAQDKLVLDPRFP